MSRLTEQLDGTGEEGLDPTGVGGNAREGMVVTSHPDAVAVGVAILEKGGNAVDAAVAAAAVLGVVDPMSTGIGGDCFALVYGSDKVVRGINGSGRSPKLASLKALADLGHSKVPERGILSVTVPGALHAWGELLKESGTMSLADVLEPAIRIARDGFQVSAVVGRDWQASEALLASTPSSAAWLLHGKAPVEGQRFGQTELAETMSAIAERGIEEFYAGTLAKAIAQTSVDRGGWLRESDLSDHESEWVEPLVGSYRGHPVYELPPNGQGIVPLLALGILDDWPMGDLPIEERTHLMVEALKVAFDDAREWVGDPERLVLNPKELLSEDYLGPRRDAVMNYAQGSRRSSAPKPDTVYVATVDKDGGCCSLINSLFMHFGSGVVVPGTGITLQNRGHLFSSDEHHVNALGPGRRPYHTIIPSMVFREDAPWLVFGVVGGFQQPQAQVQILSRIIDEGMLYADAVAAPRFRWLSENKLRLEEGFSRDVADGLSSRGHEVEFGTKGFGGAQLIAIDRGELHGASDPRKDGTVGRTKGSS